MLCFYTFRGFSHKIYAATMDGKGEEDTYNFTVICKIGGTCPPVPYGVSATDADNFKRCELLKC